MAAERVLRLGFIGLGQAVNLIVQRRHEIASLPYRITAAAEQRTEALRQFERDFGGETYTSAEAMCESPNVDVVYVATPPELHRAQVEMAASRGKHVICEKPMALSLEDCDAMIATAERHGVHLLAGHTHSFDAPIRKMREIVASGELGDLVMVNTWHFNEFNPRPWPTSELVSSHGPILNQGPHQVDIVRQIGGGLVRSLRATTIWDPLRGVEGGYVCHLEFESGAPASMVFDARGFFDAAELWGWLGESGQARDPEVSFTMRRNFRALAALPEGERERVLESQKEQGRYGGQQAGPESLKLWGYTFGGEHHQPFFGFTIVSCESGAMRQSQDGILIYDEERKREVALEKALKGRPAELMDMYNAVVHDRPSFHDGRWGRATLEVCLGILESARERREVPMTRQVPVRD